VVQKPWMLARVAARPSDDPSTSVVCLSLSSADRAGSANVAACLIGVSMSPLFGRKDEDKQEKQPVWTPEALSGELDRLSAVPLPQLAAEVMTTSFGPGCPGADDDEYFSVAGGNLRAGPSVYRIAEVLMASKGISFPYGPMKDQALQERVVRLVAEGLQTLEHAALVRAQVHSPAQSGPDYVITRRGRAALASNEVDAVLAAASA